MKKNVTEDGHEDCWILESDIPIVKGLSLVKPCWIWLLVKLYDGVQKEGQR